VWTLRWAVLRLPQATINAHCAKTALLRDIGESGTGAASGMERQHQLSPQCSSQNVAKGARRFLLPLSRSCRT
jgi:hypothetical protein